MVYIKSNKVVQKRDRWIRLIFMILILVFTTTIGLFHQYAKGVKPAGVDAFCPFGGIESAYTLIATGEMIKRVTASSFILLLVTIIIALLFRRSFCGNICAFGTLQELFGRLGKKIFRNRNEVPVKIDRSIRYIKYAVLLAIVIFSAKMGELIIRPYDPWATYHHILSKELFTEFKIGFIVLLVTLVGSIFLERFFCKYFCPMGAFLGMIYRGGWFRIRRNDSTCIHCMICNKACPVNIPVESIEEVKSSECINCNLCVNSCPVKDTLYISGPRKRLISPSFLLWVTIAIFIAVPGISTLTGSVNWTIKPLSEQVEEAGGLDPEEIRGSNTFWEISDITGIPKEEFIKRFNITEEEFEKPIKDSTHKPDSDFETEEVREFVRERISN